MTTYPTELAFDLPDPRWRHAVLDAAQRLHLTVMSDGGTAFRVTVTELSDAYSLGTLTVAFARELGVSGLPIEPQRVPRPDLEPR